MRYLFYAFTLEVICQDIPSVVFTKGKEGPGAEMTRLRTEEQGLEPFFSVMAKVEMVRNILLKM